MQKMQVVSLTRSDLAALKAVSKVMLEKYDQIHPEDNHGAFLALRRAFVKLDKLSKAKQNAFLTA